MIVNTPNGQVDTSKPAKCLGCRRVYANPQAHGSITIANGKMKFFCVKCKPPEKKS